MLVCSNCGRRVRRYAPSHNSKIKGIRSRAELRKLHLCNECFQSWIGRERMLNKFGYHNNFLGEKVLNSRVDLGKLSRRSSEKKFFGGHRKPSSK